MFKIQFLPATIGDSIWVSYGDDSSPHYLLIDGGTAGTRKHIKSEISALSEDERCLDLMVVSHVDKDHIQGIRTLLERQEIAFEVDDFWYNGFHHLPQPENNDEHLGAKQGEALSKLLVEQDRPWNQAFSGFAAVIPDDGPLPEIELPGGMKLTLLGPTREALEELRPVWIDEVEEAGIEPGGVAPGDPQDDEFLGSADFLTVDDVKELATSPWPGDGSKANKSSIAFLAEFEGKRVLFAADAHADELLAALNRLSPDEPVDVDLFKISHHGSKGTTSQELLAKVKSNHYVFSTNGSIYKHPDDETVAKVLVFGGDDLTLSFNYRKATNTVWEDSDLREHFQYTTVYPDAGEEGIEIEL